MAETPITAEIVFAAYDAEIERYRAALVRIQRPVKLSKGNNPVMLCTECGKRWPVGEPEDHWPTCATGISRAALKPPKEPTDEHRSDQV